MIHAPIAGAPDIVSDAVAGGFDVPSVDRANGTEVDFECFKNVPAGASLYVKCSGGGCPFKKTKKLTFKKATPTKDLTSLFNVKNKKTKKTKIAKLKPKAKIEIGTSAPGVLGNFISYAIQAKKAPKTSRGCLAVGSTKKTPC